MSNFHWVIYYGSNWQPKNVINENELIFNKLDSNDMNEFLKLTKSKPWKVVWSDEKFFFFLLANKMDFQESNYSHKWSPKGILILFPFHTNAEILSSNFELRLKLLWKADFSDLICKFRQEH